MKTATLATLCSAALLLGALAPAAAAKPTYAEQDDRLVLANEHIALSLQGKKPRLEVRDTTNESRGYMVFLQRLVEVPSQAGLTGSSEAASFNLARAEAWDITHTQDADGIHVTMHREGPIETHARPGDLPVPLPGPVGNLTANTTTGNASVTIVFHLYAQNRTVTAGNETSNVTVYEVKFDLQVERWDWVSRSDVLALEFLLVDQGDGNATRGEVAAGGDRMEVEDANGTRIGHVGWLRTATATTNNTASEVPVDHLGGGRGQGNAQEPSGAKHWLVYRAPGWDSLEHDPSVGIEPTNPSGTAPTGAPVPGPGLVLVLLAAAPAAALLAARRRT
ncbi:MAG TPA: hypothetical protein VGR28_05635 [Candidatus Thermoplasmatota archaeon]|jgi:hypothetical protein|nr:hypothetical protein [Candidatus Thermoplasmatota archaeon]